MVASRVCAISVGSAWAAPVNADLKSGSSSPWFQNREAANGAFDPRDVTSSDANTGTCSASGTNNTEIRINFDGIQTDEILGVSFFLKHVGAGTNGFVSLFYGNGSESNTEVTTSTADWEQCYVTSALEAEMMLEGFSIFGNHGGCPGETCTRTFLDDFVVNTSMSAVPLPARVPLMLSAFGAVAFLRHRRRVSR